jgi:hypothetical protein
MTNHKDNHTKSIVRESQFLGQPIPAMDKAALRKFGLVFAVIISTLFGVCLPYLFGFAFVLWPWMVAGVFAGLGVFVPGSLSYFYSIWMRFGVIMNMIMSRVILGSVFVLTVIPTGIILKLRGKDILDIKFDNKRQSYRVKSAKNNSEDLKKPY